MNYDIDMKKFWEMNAKCKTLSDDIPRVPVQMNLRVGDWICDFLNLDNSKRQQPLVMPVPPILPEPRLRCGPELAR